MPVSTREASAGKTLAIHIRGKLTRDDYRELAPRIERLIDEHGRINLYIRFEEFSGIEPGALWEDVEFHARHFSDFERIAVVGEQAWMKWMTRFTRPFTCAKVWFFSPDDPKAGLDWAAGTVRQ
jgi:hypothetical protein